MFCQLPHLRQSTSATPPEADEGQMGYSVVEGGYEDSQLRVRNVNIGITDRSNRIYEFTWGLVVAAIVLIIAWQVHGGNQISWRAPLAYDGDSPCYLMSTKRLAEGMMVRPLSYKKR
jgi:hypothetical protein